MVMRLSTWISTWIIPTEVQADDRSRQTDRAMYRIDPRAAGKELRLEPRPDDRTDRTGARLPRPTRQAKTDGRARTHLGRVETETDHSLSLLDLGRTGTRMMHGPYPADYTEGASPVLLLTAKESLGLDEPRLISSNGSRSPLCWTGASHPATIWFGNDAPQYMDQYIEPDPDGVQDDQIIPTEVQADDHSRQTDRAMYRIDPRAAGNEQRLEPRPDDRTDRTGARLPRPTRQAKTDGRARTHLGRVETETDHSLSLLVRLIRAECPDERTDESAVQYDQFLNFDDQNFSKARILQLSKDLGRIGTKMMHGPYPADYPEGASPVLLLTAKESLGSDEPGPPSKLFLSVGLVSHIKQRFEIATLLDRCVTSGNDLVREYQRPIRNLCATHRSISSPLEFISFPIRLSDPF
ncbi:hypothetical protein F2Q69_00028276 [Brassica cretica]|uniref:Uncharacterized protein n=1 Tax=Brassica cretica TaxID=69181 RepID=A0A8S9RUC3_BRACR|nr:hypothetical protein F2Q69_00028276 [Brassica cretica]